MTRVSFRLVRTSASSFKSERQRWRLWPKKKPRVIILPTSPATLFPPLAAITEGHLCLKHVTKWERGTGGELGRPCPVVCCRGAYLQFVWLLRRCAPLSAQRCGVGGSSRKEKKEREKEKGGIQNGIFNHLRGAAVRVPLAAFRRICPTLDPAALWLTQMRKRVFFSLNLLIDSPFALLESLSSSFSSSFSLLLSSWLHLLLDDFVL